MNSYIAGYPKNPAYAGCAGYPKNPAKKIPDIRQNAKSGMPDIWPNPKSEVCNLFFTADLARYLVSGKKATGLSGKFTIWCIPRNNEQIFQPCRVLFVMGRLNTYIKKRGRIQRIEEKSLGACVIS